MSDRTTRRACTIDGCGKPREGFGYCQMHYLRFKKHGDPHNDGSRTLEERFWEKVQKVESGCWEWIGYVSTGGYGKFRGADGRVRMAHRVWYEHVNGALSGHLELDHLCRNTRCVNPGHLDPVIAWVNNARSESASAEHLRAEECPQGHPYDDTNTYWRPDGSGRGCVACRRARDAGRRNRRTHCSRGHEFTPETVKLTPTGIRKCLICKQERASAA